MHVFTYIPPKYQAMINAKDNYDLEEARMAQMDDSVGQLLKHVEDIGETDNTIVIFTTDNGAEVFSWPDGGMTPFRATKGTTASGFRRSSGGLARSSQGLSKTESSPASIGCRRLPPPPAISTSKTSF
jgi:Sulfatase